MPEWLLPRSLTSRLVGLFTLSTLVILGISAVLLDRHMGASLDLESREFLEDTVEVVRTVVDSHPGDLAMLRMEVEGETSARSNQPTFLRILGPAQQVVAETPGMGAVVPSQVFAASQEASGIHRFETGNGRHYYLLQRSMPISGLGPCQVQAALDVDHDRRLLEGYRTSLAAMVAFGVLLAALAGVAITRTGLRPLREIGAALQQMTASRLSVRIGGARWPTELQEIAQSFDAMLERLEDAFARISHFSDDLAHELRTPLSNLRGETELALTRSRSPDELREVLTSNLEELERLGAMVEGMLFLARADDPALEIASRRLDAAAEMGAVLELYEPLAEESGVTLEASGQVEVRADPELLRRALSNLVANALRFTPSGGAIALRASGPRGGLVTLSVRDTGCGVDQRDAPRIFERFYRGDRSRTASGGGSGLGLSLVHRIMALHGGEVRLVHPSTGGATFELLFPC